MEKQRPKVGVAVIVERDGCVLLGKRLGSHGAGEWALPGGHLELFEDFSTASARELEEETGLRANQFTLLYTSNDIWEKEGLHYITLFLRAEECIGEPQLLEPNKCEGWQWFAWNKLPSPLYGPLVRFIAGTERS